MTHDTLLMTEHRDKIKPKIVLKHSFKTSDLQMESSENNDSSHPIIKNIDPENFMERYDTRKLFLGLQRHIPLILISAIIWSLLGAYMAYKLLTTYKAESVVLYQEDTLKPASTSVVPTTLTNITLPTVLDMIKLPSQFQAVKTILGLDLSIGQLDGMTQVPLPKNESNLIRIVVKGDNPNLVVDIANTLAKVSVKSSQDFSQRQLQIALNNYKSQLETAKQKLTGELQDIENFKKENNYYEMNADYSGVLKQITDAQARLQSANLTYNSLLVEYENLKREATALPDEVLGDSLNPIMDNRLVPIQNRMAIVESALADARTKYSGDNPKIKSLEDELKALNAKMNEISAEPPKRVKILQKNPIKERLEVDLINMQGKVRSAQRIKQVAAQQVESFKKQMENLPSLQIAFSKLLQAQKITEEQIRFLNNAVDTTQLMINVPKGSIELYQLADKAKPLKDAWWVELLPLIGLIFGSLFGVLAALFLEMRDQRIWTARQAELSYHVPVMSVIPDISHFTKTNAQEKTLFYIRNIAERLERIQESSPLPTGQPLSIGIISSLEREGKSTLAYNLALYYQKIGKKVLLIEGDYRHNPYTEDTSPTTFSLEGYLQNPTSSKDLIIKGAPDRIKVLHAVPEMKELVKSEAMLHLWHDISSKYNVIILDAPGIIHDDYALNLCSLVNYCIFVVDSSQVTKPVIDESLRELSLLDIKPKGIILNRVLSTYIEGHRMKIESKKRSNQLWQKFKFWK